MIYYVVYIYITVMYSYETDCKKSW